MKKDKKVKATPTPNPQTAPKPPGYWAARKADREARRQNPGQTPGATPVPSPILKPLSTPTLAHPSSLTVTPAAAKPDAPAGSPQEKALEFTREIKESLKDAALGHIRAGQLLTRMRDEKLFTALGYKTIEDYAEDRFGFEHSSLYAHIDAHAWIAQNHPEWLDIETRPKGYIPDQSKIKALIWIDEKLAQKELKPATRDKLQAMRANALSGKLSQKQAEKIKRRDNQSNDARKSLLASCRALRRRLTDMKNMPPELLTHIEAMIDIIKKGLGDSPA